MSYLCPKCSRAIYNRRLKTCGFCGAELPPELLFSAAELEMLDKREKDTAVERQAKLKADELEQQEVARQRDYAGGNFGGIFKMTMSPNSLPEPITVHVGWLAVAVHVASR